MATTHKKPPKSKRQPEVGRLFARVKTMPSKKRFIANKAKLRGKTNEKSRLIKATSKRHQKRDKYGRFVKVNRLKLAKRNPARIRDEKGRFVASSSQQKIHRDKRGRFAKAPAPWYRHRYAALVPLILGISGVMFFGYRLNQPIIIDEPVAASQLETVEPKEPEIAEVTVALSRSEPTRLRIPKIAVNTSFTDLGKKADGTIQVPSDPYVVGWYTKAPTPGELGPAIVIGHVDRPGGPAVFWRLRELVPGDTFAIDRADGTTVKFKVDDVKKVPQVGFPTEEVYGNIDYAGIRLITCTGTWDRYQRRYSDNLIVYGSLVVENQTDKTAAAL
ncbi:MAG: class F sortase [Candidatus Saccharimonadales bacterium]